MVNIDLRLFLKAIEFGIFGVKCWPVLHAKPSEVRDLLYKWFSCSMFVWIFFAQTSFLQGITKSLVGMTSPLFPLWVVWKNYLIDPFSNYDIYGKTLTSVSFDFNEFSQIANIESKLTTYWHKGVNNLELLSSVSTISHEGRLLPQCFSANVVIIKGST